MKHEIAEAAKAANEQFRLAEAVKVAEVIKLLMQNPAPQGKTPDSIFFTYLKDKKKIDNERRLTDKLNRIIAWLKQNTELQEMGIVVTPEVLISEGIRKRNGNLYTPKGIRRTFTAN